MGNKREPSYTRALIINHGKSEVQICKYIRQKLRLSIEIYADKNGEKSIQITSLFNTLNNAIFKNLDDFLREYPKVNVKGKGNKRVIQNFKLFIIMDTDDCTIEQKNNYINKSMFKKHWAYRYIVPIYNITNLEDVMKECNIKYETVIKKEYIKIFPTDKKYKKSDTIQLTEFMQSLQKTKKSNLEKLIEYCLSIKKTFS